MLQAYVHVSTAYANCHLDTIDETLYAAPIEHERLRQIVENVDDEELLDAVLPKWANCWQINIQGKILSSSCPNSIQGEVDNPCATYRYVLENYTTIVSVFIGIVNVQSC